MCFNGIMNILQLSHIVRTERLEEKIFHVKYTLLSFYFWHLVYSVSSDTWSILQPEALGAVSSYSFIKYYDNETLL